MTENHREDIDPAAAPRRFQAISLADAVDPGEAARKLAELKAAVRRTAESMPGHQAFIERFCDARGAA